MKLKEAECYFKQESVTSNSRVQLQTEVTLCYLKLDSQNQGEVDLEIWLAHTKQVDFGVKRFTKNQNKTKQVSGKSPHEVCI